MSEEPKARVLRRTGSGLKPDVKPIVLEYKRDKEEKTTKDEKSKAKYSKGLEDVQTLESDILRVSQKAAKAFSKGIDTYQAEREKSAEEKTDGAIEDFVHNSAKAMSASLKEASDLPMDIAESINKDSYRKRLRKALKETSKAISFWRL
jgi:citrate synthase